MPFTVASVVILVCLLGTLATIRMRTDIFPQIDIPVVSVVWTYTGMSAEEIQDRILSIHERQMPAQVDDIERLKLTRTTAWVSSRFIYTKAPMSAGPFRSFQAPRST